jgi:hypothetical protein
MPESFRRHHKHPIPPFAAAVETRELVSVPTTVTELPEIVTAAVMVTSMSRKTTVTLLFLMSILFVDEEPKTKTVTMKG